MAQMKKHRASKIYRGTVEEVFSHRNEIPHGAMIELKVFDATPAPSHGKSSVTEPKELRGYGMLADVSSVDEFMRRKREDVELEDHSRQ